MADTKNGFIKLIDSCEHLERVLPEEVSTALGATVDEQPAVHFNCTDEYGAFHAVAQEIVKTPNGGFRAIGALQQVLEEVIDGAPEPLASQLRDEVRERFKDRPKIVTLES